MFEILNEIFSTPGCKMDLYYRKSPKNVAMLKCQVYDFDSGKWNVAIERYYGENLYDIMVKIAREFGDSFKTSELFEIATKGNCSAWKDFRKDYPELVAIDYFHISNHENCIAKSKSKSEEYNFSYLGNFEEYFDELSDQIKNGAKYYITL